MKIEVNGLSFTRGKKQILRGVDAVFEGNAIYGIIGPNGCGKTTLLRHLYREYPSRGYILLDGLPIDGIPRVSYARRIAVMMQRQIWAEAEIRVFDVVETGRFPYKEAVLPYSREDRAVVEAVLREMDLWEMRDRRIGTLSGGELQRVVIAKCLAQQPDAILLDEPTNHLDIQYKVELMKRLRRFGGMVIMTLHDLNLAARCCDYIYLMSGGRFSAGGKPQEILRPELLKGTFHTDLRVLHQNGEIFIGI